jgi:GH25 family lysozyme M1 (1,4-beta-N-acetylmuramidase)
MDRAHGIDISKWQSFYRPATNPPRPVDFVIQRLSYGLIRDQGLAVLTPPVMQAAIKGAYHYVSSAVDWKSQADLFLQLMDDKYDFWAWDVEKAYNSDGIVKGVVPAMEYLLDKTGKPGLLYTNPDMWGTWYKSIQAQLLKYDLWIAHYWWIPNPEKEPNYWTVGGASTMRRDWRFWQYDMKGMGNRGKEFGVGSYGLDLNVFNGTVDDLWKWARPGQPPAPRICPTCGQVWPTE